MQIYRSFNTDLVLDNLLRTFREIDDVETGDLELQFKARECLTVTPRYAEVIPRQGMLCDGSCYYGTDKWLP